MEVDSMYIFTVYQFYVFVVKHTFHMDHLKQLCICGKYFLVE